MGRLVAGDVVLVQQSVPALNLFVLVLQALVPVLQPLSLSGDAQLATSCRGRERQERDMNQRERRDMNQREIANSSPQHVIQIHMQDLPM